MRLLDTLAAFVAALISDFRFVSNSSARHLRAKC